jgi:hypothetical protein
MEDGEIFPKVTEAKKIKAEKGESLDKLDVISFVRGDLQKKMHPNTMEDHRSIS